MSRKKTRVMFIKYHEAADQQPLSKKAAEKLGIFPSLALGGLAAWVRQNGFSVNLLDLHVENIYPKDAVGRVQDYDPHTTIKNLKMEIAPGRAQQAAAAGRKITQLKHFLCGYQRGTSQQSSSWLNNFCCCFCCLFWQLGNVEFVNF